MNPVVVVANHVAHEARPVVAALSQEFKASAVADATALLAAVDGASAVVLDSNFSPVQGIDVLMEVLARKKLPVIMLMPRDQTSCATEALRCGASGYLIKSGKYARLIAMAVRDAISRFRANEDMKREIVELRKRNATLEKDLKALRIQDNLGVTAVLAKTRKDEDAGADIEEIIAARIKSGTLQLPAYPHIATKLRELLAQDVGIAEVAQLLSQDAAVSAKLLRVANASQYGNLRRVESVEGAVSRLGLTTACSVAQMIANRSLYSSRNAAYRGMLDDLWIHSIAVAHASVAIARHVGMAAPQQMFSLGLLHDSGRLALMQAVAQGDPHGKCIEGDENRKTFRYFLRKHNVECGVALMRRWGFNQDFEDAVRYNYNLKGADKPTRSLLIVNLANVMSRAIGYGNPLESQDEWEQSPAKGYLFPGDSDLTPIIDEVHQAVDRTRKMLA